MILKSDVPISGFETGGAIGHLPQWRKCAIGPIDQKCCIQMTIKFVCLVHSPMRRIAGCVSAEDRVEFGVGDGDYVEGG
jgi:hypothetical protein